MGYSKRHVCTIEVGPGRIKAVHRTPRGVQHRVADGPFDFAAAKALDDVLEDDGLLEYGRRLFNELLGQKDITSLLDGALKDQDKRLQIRLELVRDLQPELLNLPWEALCDPEGSELALLSNMDDYGLVRCIRSRAIESRNLTPSIERPRILVVVCNPRLMDLVELPGGAGDTISFNEIETVNKPDETKALLDLFDELKEDGLIGDFRLLRGQLPGDIGQHEALLQGNPSLANISQELKTAQEEDRAYHVVHFLAHGYLDDDGKGYLLLSTNDGVATLVPDTEFKDIFPMVHGVRLVLLAACQSAEGDQQIDRPLAGLAPKFLQAGIPSVIAMQGKISVGAAGFFTKTFYRQLAIEGLIDAAMVAARREVRQQGTAADPEWYYPVLYMQSDDPRLFDQAAELQQRLDTELEELESLQIRSLNLEREQDMLRIKDHYLKERTIKPGLSREEEAILGRRRVDVNARLFRVKREMGEVEERELQLLEDIEQLEAGLEELGGREPLFTQPTLYGLASKLSQAFKDELGQIATEVFGIDFSDPSVADSVNPDGQALSLVKYLYNEGQLDRLLRVAKNRFPDVNW